MVGVGPRVLRIETEFTERRKMNLVTKIILLAAHTIIKLVVNLVILRIRTEAPGVMSPTSNTFSPTFSLLVKDDSARKHCAYFFCILSVYRLQIMIYHVFSLDFDLSHCCRFCFACSFIWDSQKSIFQVFSYDNLVHNTSYVRHISGI